MSKFKVGDRVVFISCPEIAKNMGTGTVVSVDGRYVTTKWDNAVEECTDPISQLEHEIVINSPLYKALS
jgi:hypothetical protein